MSDTRAETGLSTYGVQLINYHIPRFLTVLRFPAWASLPAVAE